MKSGSLTPASGPLAVAVLAALFAAAPARPQTAAELAQLDQALERRDLPAASAQMNRLVAARRPAPGGRRSDPLLNGLAGRLHLAAGLPALALSYLERADAADVPPAQRIESLFALAEAQSLTGAPEAAAATLARLEDERLAPEQQRRRLLAMAELGLAADPRAALARVQPLLAAADAGSRFEAELLASRAHALLGERDTAVAAAARAWAAALASPPERLAPLRAALLQAGLAAAASNRGLLLEMLNLAGARAAPVGTDIATYLPRCGEDGVTPDDHVTVAVYASAFDWQRLMLISASRPQAAAAFLRRLAGRDLLNPQGHWPLGTIVTLRCRTIATTNYEFDPAIEPYTRLFAEHGIYLQAGLQWDPARVAVLEGEIAEIEARQGRDHPDLIPLLAELNQRVEWRIRTANAAGEADLPAIRRRFFAAVRRLPGAEALVPSEEEFDLVGSPQAIDRHRALWRQRVGRAPFDLAYGLAMSWLAADIDLPGPQAREVVEELLARFQGAPNDPRRLALLMRLGKIRMDQGDLTGGRAAYRAAGAPQDSCLVLHQGMNPVSGEFGEDAYPHWALRYDLPGRTIIEYGIAADGSVTGQRVIVSAPSTIFDEAATGRFATFRYAPADAGARPRACGGRTQSVTWRMADPEETIPDYDLYGIDPT